VKYLWGVAHVLRVKQYDLGKAQPMAQNMERTAMKASLARTSTNDIFRSSNGAAMKATREGFKRRLVTT
jgi:hypothetical protein